MTNNYDRLKRVGIASAPLAIALFGILGPIVEGGLLLKCHKTSDCDPFGGQSMQERIEEGAQYAKAIGTANQFIYGVRVDDNTNLLPASRKYAWCREGPGTPGEYRCSGAPEADDITTAVNDFTPYPTSMLDAIPFFNAFTYKFALSKDGDTLIDAGNGEPTTSPSTFLFALPLAGGNNAELELVMSKGQTTVGVVMK